jgi:abortive infection bacteriophage resistance protein
VPNSPFNKPALSLAEQIALLQSRGLEIEDIGAATAYLRHVGYYRLSGYALPFQTGGAGSDRHSFRPGTSFNTILERYVFDRKLRLLVMDAIERIEISIRSVISNSISARHGPHWYQDRSMFNSEFDHQDFIEKVRSQINHYPKDRRKRDVHIEHYYQNYSSPEMPPCWMIFESVSFGVISTLYKNLIPSEFGPISTEFGIPHPVLASWLHSISYIRNICAHHSRLWNLECRIKPIAANAFRIELTPNERVYAQLVVMQILLRRVSPGNHWAEKIKTLLTEHPNIPIASMGFRLDWADRRLWKV